MEISGYFYNFDYAARINDGVSRLRGSVGANSRLGSEGSSVMPDIRPNVSLTKKAIKNLISNNAIGIY